MNPEQTKKWFLKTTVVLLALIFAVTSVLASGIPALWLESGDGIGLHLINPGLLR
ncbi:hypothetical protein OK351_16770 [Glutamicibacter sp. MNS18]|uniref:hypothetical protein n=1 Tax=Glutamicibacter sp. MNS18 TaxID=2989817 RepID=UPI00223692F5|nr:hypothetical protein [Glutamicibacter sp. MNS18]MCW4467137.1 hypothetical protein [Glutamicibacter sp. MNS18]